MDDRCEVFNIIINWVKDDEQALYMLWIKGLNMKQATMTA